MTSVRNALIGAVAILVSAGCGPSASAPVPPSPAPEMSRLPPRPMTLTFDGVDPCDLLSAEHSQSLGVELHDRSSGGGIIVGTTCSWWSNSTAKGYYHLDGSLLTKPGAEFALGKDPMRFVQGFATTSTTSIGTDPRWYCAMFVDIAPGKSLYTIYDNATHDIPGMNHQLACEKAQQLAEYMLTALKARQPR